MKKRILSVLIASIVLVVPMAQEAEEVRDYRLEAAQMLQQGNKALKGERLSELQDIVFHLSNEEKESLYESFKKKSAGSAVLNWIPGFGSGSYSQGDAFGGTVILLSDICTTGAVVVGTGALCVAFVAVIFEGPLSALSGNDEMETTDKYMSIAGISFLVGGGLWLCTRIFGTFRPIVYKNAYNKKLRSVLSPTEDVIIEPAIDPVAKTAGITARVWL
ncbi:MAG: P13 family porin [Treponema sp.]|nr:P13 family porin [Treponema sp.]